MIPYERQERIIAFLETKEIIKIDELQKVIPNISISTLRRDLKELEKLGKVNMLIGGAVKLSSSTSELPISAKSIIQTEQKEIIASLAAREINDGDVIYLDSGSTCTALLNKILDKKISIFTTNTSIFNISTEIRAEITILGGRYSPFISSINGPLTDSNIQLFNFDKAFLGANGVDIVRGVSTPTLTEANKKKEILKAAKKAFLLCDSSKIHKSSAVKAFELNEVTLITDQYDKDIAELTSLIAPESGIN
ncbi:DeoR/GlpR transcriptional regulator [Listeria sp. FSL L7-1485]|uniref:DeoR/GlpR transcriptional regulator n=1 Tax=Listeria immobilis TaxID=2713502 RepID=A0A7X0X583_9LIST|nr:DeoR/GlpR family DNA-binding transcription regulator [Listeria immobilis]MBC1482070.1 DeoR/GlpR transcriptional regulator [Listeria immobilis]MBC1487750.1 DeoR/GlpR transcriptional regulator [Listeria immobilis]MBC1505461.1 DeoR/GlpR transcriptional regulator [Listeria immobilis]MBC1509106.1 DeoR/GlpR transcriptional regulator [Listeria immobilis]MBC1514611.1 DeoR/GlpR transcriptional regulator [Listeria immobilis]